MIDCPLCDFPNIEGEDFCQECGQPLSDSHLTTPPTAVERSLIRDRIQVLEPAKPITVESDTPVRDVLQLLIEHSIGCVLVVDEGTLSGVFTERDALQQLAGQDEALGECPVSQFMTRTPRTLSADAKIAFAVRQMDQGGYRHIPIVDPDDRAIGVVSVRDILRYFTDKMRESANREQV